MIECTKYADVEVGQRESSALCTTQTEDVLKSRPTDINDNVVNSEDGSSVSALTSHRFSRMV